MSNITMSRPAGAALLRKLTNPLYDTTILENAAAVNALQFFRLPIGVNMPVTAVAKTEADTNLTQAGQLGTPQMFDLEGFNFEFMQVDPTDVANNIADLLAVYEEGLFSFFFGQQRPWLEIPVSQIPTGIYLTGTMGFGDTAASDEAMFIGQGQSSCASVYNFTVGKKAIRLHSAEPFNAEVNWPNGAITPAGADQRIRTYMVGSLYAAL
jgi:hypothetical protein